MSKKIKAKKYLLGICVIIKICTLIIVCVFELCAQHLVPFTFCYNSCSYVSMSNAAIVLFITIKTIVLFSSVGWVVLLWV